MPLVEAHTKQQKSKELRRKAKMRENRERAVSQKSREDGDLRKYVKTHMCINIRTNYALLYSYRELVLSL